MLSIGSSAHCCLHRRGLERRVDTLDLVHIDCPLEVEAVLCCGQGEMDWMLLVVVAKGL